jgi:hypothetical protein
VLNLIFVHAAHHHLMGNLSLLQQTAPSWRRGCQQQQNKQATFISLILVAATLGMKREENDARSSKVVTSSTTLVSERALKRARQAMRCLPFRRAFYNELEHEARSSTQLSSQKDWMAISRKPLSRSSTEDDLIWLIQVGVLRREVDGQGLTERVRLTPMGRDLLDNWDGEIPSADALQVMHHWLRRHRPRL